ncbi:MAG: DUF3153 domain-containing protein [Spirulina sp.]
MRGIRNLGLGLMMGLALLLNGCFQADLTLRFDHHHHGQWSQTVTLGERNLAFASDALTPWLQQLRPAVQRLGGRLRQTPTAIELTVPFSTPADLAERFNRVLADPIPGEPVGSLPGVPLEAPAATVITLPALGTVPFYLETQEQNWGLFSRVRLRYDLDLRGVEFSSDSAIGSDGLLANPVSLAVQVPWGISLVETESLVPAQTNPTEARWILPLGEQSHIDVRFWLPNWIGLGGVILAFTVLMGYVMRYRWLGPPR